MKPISEVFHGDCMEFMAGLPDGCFDLAVVDPPYGIEASEMQMGLGKGKKASKKKNRKWIKKEWDSSAPHRECFTELFRVSKNQIIWGGNYFNLPVFNHYIIWDKEIPPGLSFSDCELAWTSFDGAQRMFRHSAYLDKKNKIARVQDYKVNIGAEKEEKHSKPKHPFSHLPANKLTKYALQLSFYASILKKHGWTIEGLDVFIFEHKWVHHQLDLIDFAAYREEIQKMG